MSESSTAQRWPRVSFTMPVLNAGAILEEALKTIRSQDYPDVEIIVADGMSTDNTREICRRYNCIVIDNVRVEAEIGVELARQKAGGEFVFVMAADNGCPQPQWIKQMVKPFLDDPKVTGVYTRMVPAPEDSSLNTYLCELHVDPFTWFVFGNTAHPDHFARAYPVVADKGDYIIYQFNVKRFPLIAWAQGFGVRKSYQRDPATMGDDILPIIQMIEQGRKLAYVPQAGCYHHHLTDFRSFLKKYRARVLGNLHRRAFGLHNRQKYISTSRRLRSYLWVIYGCTIIGPLAHALFWFLRSGKAFWLWHFPANVCLAYITVFEVLRFRLGKLFSRSAVQSQKAVREKPLIPKLKTGQRSVVFAEVSTGILLTPQGERHIGQGPFYQVFDSQDEAVAFAGAYANQHPTIECSIRDEDGKHLQFIRKQG